MLKRIIPTVPYVSLRDGLEFFVTGMRFEAIYKDDVFAVLERAGIKLYLVEDVVLAARDRPQLTIETDDIEAAHAEVVSTCPQYLHPDAATVTVKPWGGREFALRDPTDVCILFRQYDGQG